MVQEEEEKYLSSAGAGILEGKTQTSVLAGTGAGIIKSGNRLDEAPKTIGSIRNGQVNYQKEHTFFNKGHHMFPKAQAVRDVVHSEIDKDLLGTKTNKWSSSVQLPYNVRG